MKIIISSTGSEIDDIVDARFGRCPYFVVVEIKNNEIKSTKAIKNTATMQATGAGINAAQVVANENPDAVISTNIGPKALSVFSQLSIPIYPASGKISDAVQQFIDGKLTKIPNATGPMGFGMGMGAGRRAESSAKNSFEMTRGRGRRKI